MPVSSADLGPVLVTGASGFIGSSVVRALLDRGARVRALIEPGRDDDNLAGLGVERVVGDIRDAATVDEAVDGISTVFHLAAIYRFWAADPDLFYDVNVGGTMNVLHAATRSKIRRLVYTSTVATLGVAENGRPASEQSLVHFEHLFGHYKRSKYLAEHEVLRAGASGLPVVLVHPTFPVGEGDAAREHVAPGDADDAGRDLRFGGAPRPAASSSRAADRAHRRMGRGHRAPA
jgi:dihydroflavonol-4-reductase